ncbi:Unknown protein [Striga hermonthica]|uniref:ATPase AAA-type core domain-containing protein n=1 Tax=Striga hermonthica TaxID=68872 RepID=A0A9N7R0T8_STRHE|nr:Unknown protein [Striga hermonthica]
MGEKITEKRKLELRYGVHLSHPVIKFAAKFLQECEGNSKMVEDNNVWELIECACQRWRTNYDSDSEEKELDWDEYYLNRAFVEATELRKEKSLFCRSVLLPRVEKEFADFTNKWDDFKRKWARPTERMRHKSEERVGLLERLRDAVGRVNKYAEVDELIKVLPPLGFTAHRLMETIPIAFHERRAVLELDILQAMSSKTGLPLKCFQSHLELRTKLENMGQRLSERLVGLDDLVVKKITSALLARKFSASFFFLGRHGCGRTKLARVLAEELFDDKGRIMKLDMSEYGDSDCVSRLIAALNGDKRRGKIVMLDNIENAHSCCDEVLVGLLKDGRVIDENGVHVDFSLDILIVSSHVGHQFLFHCRCLHETLPKIPFRKILKEPTLVHRGMHLDPGKAFDGCDIHRFYVEVAQRFRAEFVDLFDDLLVFPRMRPWDYYTIFWLQHREAAMRMTSSHNFPVIMYPTDAALSYMTTWPDMFERGAHAYETWYEAHKVQMLNRDILEKVTDKTIIIYIDTFLGSWEYSFRVETISHLEEHPAFQILKESIRHLRSKYRRERQQVNKIYMVLASYFCLLEQINSKSETNDANIRKLSEKIVILIDEVVKFEKVQTEDFFDKCSPSDQETRIEASEWLKLVSTKLQTSLVLKEDRATRGTIEVLLSQLNNNGDQSTKSFLCLGLKPNSLEQYAKSLAQQLVIDDGEKLMIQVDLSLCTGPESFFRCSDIGNPHLLLMEFIKKSPYSVIVFYELEKAHVATFSIILSILERGVTKDKDGNIVDFSHTVIVIVSHLGNKEMIGGFNGHHTKIDLSGFFKSTPKAMDGFSTSLPGEKGLIGLRTELLNRLDFMILFDPFCEEQLNAFAKVGMKHLRDGDGWGSLSVAFRNLFKADGNKRPSYTTHDMLTTIVCAGGKDAIVRYRCG